MAKHESNDWVWNEAALREVLIDQLAKALKTHRTEVAPDKLFDEYGLDSIDAVIATGEIGERIGIELPPEFLFYHRSVNAVVDALLDKTRTNIPVGKPQANKVLIFLFLGGDGIDQRSLVRFREQGAAKMNFEVVRIGDWRDWIENDLDFDAIAEAVRVHVSSVQTEGPVYLAGYSQGGHLAFASALALERTGRPVRFVGLLDSVAQRPLNQTSRKVGTFRRAVRLISRYIGAAVRGKDRYQTDTRIRLVHYLWRLCLGPAERRRLLMFVARFGALFHGTGGVKLNSYIRMRLFAELADAWFAKSGQARRLHAPVFLFRSDDPGHPDHGWAAFCPKLTVVRVGGNHITMLNAEYLETLVTRFAAAAQGEVHCKCSGRSE